MNNVITYQCQKGMHDLSVFLGGSTAKGDWQKLVIDHLASLDVDIVNTSRPDWDIKTPTADEKISHVSWEMAAQYNSSIHFIYIPEDTKSPTALLELGLSIANGNSRDTIVCVARDYPYMVNALSACMACGMYEFYFDFGTALEALYDMVENF